MAPIGDAIKDTTYRAKDYCFTAYCETAPVEAAGVTYLVFQREAGNETHREHWQGYVEFQNAKSFKAAQKCLKIGFSHMEKRKGTPTQAAEYCMKEETRKAGTIPKEFGERKADPAQGKRSDLEDVAKAVIAKKRVREVALEFPIQYIKYHRGIEKLRAFQIEKRNKKPTVTVFVGPTGTGKSRKARELLPNAYVWGPEQKEWFDGYDGEDEVILEEFRGQMPYGMLLRLTDRYACQVQMKGSMIQFCATKIAITSPEHPDQWYKNLSENDLDAQIYRRITKIVELTNIMEEESDDEDENNDGWLYTDDDE